MLNAKLRYQMLTPYWVPRPRTWKTDDCAGISFFADECRPGLFNIAWLFLNSRIPPDSRVYREHHAELAWVIQVPDKLMFGGRSLEYHAAMLPLPMFAATVLRPAIVSVSPYLTTLRINALEHDSRRARTTR